MSILVTGANGFVGRALCRELTDRGHRVLCVMRGRHAASSDPPAMPACDRVWFYDTLNRHTDFRTALTDREVVIHLAARAHMPTRNDFDMHEDFLEINYYGTLNLARQAAREGVRRFIFISSIGVNGQSTPRGYRCTEADREDPYNSYTMSKYKAETGLQEIARQTGMDVVIIRPPLVYGPGVKANFLRLMNLVRTGLPLPFARMDNVRSFVAIDNLTDAIALCVSHPAAANETFIVCDPDPLSTPDLLRKISGAMGTRLRLFYCPRGVAKTLAGLMGKQGIYNRLWGNLAAGSEKIRTRLDWTPTVGVDEEIRRTVAWYCDHAGSGWPWGQA